VHGPGRRSSVRSWSSGPGAPGLRGVNRERYKPPINALTGTAVHVVKVAGAVLVRAFAGAAVEAGDARAAAARLLDEHRLVQVLLDLERGLAPLHELGRLRELLLPTLARLLPLRASVCAGRIQARGAHPA
jgi:hypothetical protein